MNLELLDMHLINGTPIKLVLWVSNIYTYHFRYIYRGSEYKYAINNGDQ